MDAAVLEPDRERVPDLYLRGARDHPAVLSFRNRVPASQGREGTEDIKPLSDRVESVLMMRNLPRPDRG